MNSVGDRSEQVANWYFRLNGFLSIPGFVLHPDKRQRFPLTEADLMGVRFANSVEEIDGRKMVDDSQVRFSAGTKADRRTEGRRAVGSNAELATGMGKSTTRGSNTGIRIKPKAQACLPRSRLAQYADPARWCRGRNSSRAKLIT
jgi:hypothetical protein